MSKVIGILGGSFDPVHNGHLQIAHTLLRELPLSEVRFLPSKQNLLKSAAHASAEQRLTMLKIALQKEPGLSVDKRELDRKSPSYMTVTLASIREEVGDTPICLIIGMDVFQELCDWHEWEQLIQLAHIVVMNRPGYQATTNNEALAHLIHEHKTNDKNKLSETASGCLYNIAIPPISISSTEIRQAITAKRNVSQILPQGIWDYIQEHHLYTGRPS